MRGPVPEKYRFLSDMAGSFGIRSGDIRTPFPNLRVELRYDSDHLSTVEFGADDAVIHLNVRFVEAVVDFVSCLRLSDERASGARAFLTIYKLVLDLALSRGDERFVVGLTQDYIVSRVTAECEIPDVTADEVDFSGTDLLDVGEKVATYICAHEIGHWLLAHDPEYREAAIEEVQGFLANASAHSTATTPAFQAMLSKMADAIAAHQTDAALPDHLEEWVCDYLAAKGIGRAIAGEASRVTAEACLYAANIMLWARARFRAMLSGEMQDAERIDSEIGTERATMLIFSLFSAQIVDENTVVPERPKGDFLDRLNSLTERSVAGFLEGQNIVRLIGIGTIATEFGFTDIRAARTAIARITEWDM